MKKEKVNALIDKMRALLIEAEQRIVDMGYTVKADASLDEKETVRFSKKGNHWGLSIFSNDNPHMQQDLAGISLRQCILVAKALPSLWSALELASDEQAIAIAAACTNLEAFLKSTVEENTGTRTWP